jgi:tRNA(adenine34) deaminase
MKACLKKRCQSDFREEVTPNLYHKKFMMEALKLAEFATSLGEVPVGAVVVVDQEIVGFGFNRRELRSSCIEHAEMNALSEASKNLGRWRLMEATVYSTLEPCLMCAGAMIHARIHRLVYGAADPKFGAIESLYAVASDQRLNHRFHAMGGILANESRQLLKDFFLNLRKVPFSRSGSLERAVAKAPQT